ncbi:MAG: P-type conjugative transfer protein TrbG [Desulfobulbaceae bacterium]|nr:P-type conjugative transfer protein TrbG [Desulfobulbaceae bacterium]
MNKKSVICGMSFLILTSCAHQPLHPESVTYVEATKLPPLEPEQVVVEVPQPMPLPGQMQEHPFFREDERGEGDRELSPDKVIENANDHARNKPDSNKYFNSIMRFDYAEGTLYQVYAAPLKFTDIQLQPGERVMGEGPICGDTVRWVMGQGISKKDGVEQEHIYLKPTEPNLHTTFTINTDRRTYHLEIHSFKDTYMAAVNWRYPKDEVAKIRSRIERREREENSVTSTIVSLDDVDNNYDVKIMKGQGDIIKWLPQMVFDDGHKTFIKFPREMLEREAPVLFVLSSDEETQLVNYRVKNDYYIVDRLFTMAELRLGQKNQDIVRITRVD